MTKDQANFSIGPDINTEVLLRYVTYLILSLPYGFYLSFKLRIFELVSSVERENTEVHSPFFFSLALTRTAGSDG